METDIQAPVITRLKCLRCQHTWYPKTPAVPAHCPGCNSPYWTKPKNDVNRVVDPTTKKYRLLCLRCGHDWSSDNSHPTRCAKCKSPYWDKPGKEAHDVNRVKEAEKDAPVNKEE